MIDATNVDEARVKYDFLPKIIPNITVAQATKIIDSYASLQGACPAIYHLAIRPVSYTHLTLPTKRIV